MAPHFLICQGGSYYIASYLRKKKYRELWRTLISSLFCSNQLALTTYVYKCTMLLLFLIVICCLQNHFLFLFSREAWQIGVLQCLALVDSFFFPKIGQSIGLSVSPIYSLLWTFKNKSVTFINNSILNVILAIIITTALTVIMY